MNKGRECPLCNRFGSDLRDHMDYHWRTFQQNLEWVWRRLVRDH